MSDNKVSAERLHKLTGPLAAECMFKKLEGAEQLGTPFEYDVEVLSPNEDISPYKIIGKEMSIAVELPNGDKRYFHGIITQFLNAGTDGGYQLYQVKLRPWFWLLTHSLDSRIFQEQSVPQIIEKVFKVKNGFSDYELKLKDTYAPQEYCVQYGESDFDFVSRLMEQEGIFYYFEHTESKHTLVLADSKSGLPSVSDPIAFRPPNEVVGGHEHVYHWKHHVAVQPGELVTRDFDYNKPNANLEVRLNTDRKHPHSKILQYEYPGDYSETSGGERYLRFRSEEFDVKFTQIVAKARTHRLYAGVQFTLEDHPREEENAKYMVVSASILVTAGDVEAFSKDPNNRIEVKFTAIPAANVFRTPRVTPKPVIAGAQTAIVVGKAGEEIWTDSMGRVKVQFAWDREGKKDESSSCWIRVAQIWSGKGWGSMHVPRIGQEVVVEFLEGDPNRPLITGRVYNGENGTPYALPNLATQSGIKSRSTPKGDKDSFNELRFEDKKNEEVIYFHAEKDFERIVENNDSLKVGFIKKDKGNQTIEIFGNQDLKIGTSESDGGNQTTEVWQDRTTTIKNGNDTLTISMGDQKIDVTSGQCEITAAKKIILKVGSSSIEITPTKIFLKSTEIVIQADMKAEVSAATTDIKGSAMVKIQGGVVKIN